MQVQEGEEKKWGQQSHIVHVPKLVESAVYQFCGNVVTDEDGPKCKRRVWKIENWNKERQMKNEGKRVIGMFWFDERATQNGHVSI